MVDGLMAAHKRKVEAFKHFAGIYKKRTEVSLCKVVRRTLDEIPSEIVKDLERGRYDHVNTNINKGIAISKLVFICKGMKE